MSEEKKRLNEITLMRTILALLIVFMHAFTCYQGAWEPPMGYMEIPLYKWIARTSFAFTLEAFVFISGYLFAFQRITLKRTVGGISLIGNKLKRLILPSIIFSALYFLLFYEYKGVPNLLFNLLNGCGHMWFLPMLFWCFIGAWLLEQIKIGDGCKIALLICLNLFWPIPLPFGLTVAANYILYFYLGCVVYKFSEKIKDTISLKHVIICWSVFVVLFVIFRPLKETLTIGNNCNEVFRMLSLSARDACRLVYASVGTMSFYLSAVYYTERHKLSTFTVHLANCCFGIYLFQEFILKLIYYKTDFSIIVGPYFLPWLSFIIASVVSYCLASMLLKTKFGKYLIG